MGSIATSINKVLNLRFLLIFLTVVMFILGYFDIILKDSFWSNYSKYLDLKNIVIMFTYYLILASVIAPMIALMLSFILWTPIGILFAIFNPKWLNFLSEILSNDELAKIEKIRQEASEENNSVKIKLYELELEEYREANSIYLYSFLLLVESLYLWGHGSPNSIHVIEEITNTFCQTKDSEYYLFVNFFLAVIPNIMLLIFSIRYVASFNSHKIHTWLRMKFRN